MQDVDVVEGGQPSSQTGQSGATRVELEIGGNTFILETGWLAKQAAASTVVRYGDTVVLNAVTTGPPRAGIDFFPLTCDYRERTSAAGKFPGGFIKREGRPSMKETLTSRLIDRPIRPMFPAGFRDEVQCQSLVVSSDRQNDADVLAMNGVAAALFISPIPFEGPVASVRVGRVDGEWIAFPTSDDLERSDVDVVVSGTEEAVTMIEGFAREVPEPDMVAVIRQAHTWIRELCALQRRLAEKVGKEKTPFEAPDDGGLYDRLRAAYYDKLRAAKETAGKQARAEAVAAVREEALAEIIPDPEAEDAVDPGRFQTAWHDLEKRVVRDLILAGRRPDGRDCQTLREIECHVDVLPRTHGSAVFQRGETQALVSVTLGTTRDEQRVDGIMEEYSKKFMLDYIFPPFSVGEVRPIRGPGRREIGHGALAERSVNPVMPPPEKFPYTVRVVSDILESNGSSSMASVCGATLALMAAGVQISNPVAGISIGLVKEEDRWVLLTDIIGDEDHFGDMDFKVAGTQRGITGIQLDLKIRGIDEAIIEATLQQAREARIQILRKMLSVIGRPRGDVSPFAPRLVRLKIDPDKIGALIGPGGRNIRSIQDSTGTVVEVEDDGTVLIAGSNREWTEKALALVEAATASVQIGRIYDGTVTSITDFGAFVEILPGRDGLVHISELSSGYIERVEDVCQVGDPMKVQVIAMDEHDRVKLSRKRALEELGLPDELATRERPPREGGRERSGEARGASGGRRRSRGGNGSDRRDRRGGDRDRSRGGRSGGRGRRGG